MTLPSHLSVPSLDSDRSLQLFLPYQHAWILDDSPLRLAEKSVRIGWTYADAFKNVRKRLLHPRRDYLFTSKDLPTALEYIRTCYQFLEIFHLTQSVSSHTVEFLSLPKHDASGRPTGFHAEIKAGIIRFDNASRILAFSSNPNALRAFGGDVGLDEFAFHPAAEQLWAAAAGRLTWGFDLGLWSSSNGDATLFHSFAREARHSSPLSLQLPHPHLNPNRDLNLNPNQNPNPNPPPNLAPTPRTPSPALPSLPSQSWSYYRVTLLDAVQAGLVEKINQTTGRHQTRAQFIQDCKNRARLPEIFEQEYLCHPRGGLASIVPWPAIARCQLDYSIERLHLDDQQIIAQFGEFYPQRQPEREQTIAASLASAFATTLAHKTPHALGFDVAASGAGDLAAIYIDTIQTGRHQLCALFTCRTQDWHFLKSVLSTFLRHLPALCACGDETGLGRQICWEAAQAFPGRFRPVNFRTEKHNLGFVLMNQLTAAEKIFPANQPDIAADYYALRKLFHGNQWTFTEAPNPANPASHCDLAWAGALASKAASLYTPPSPIKIFPRLSPRLRAKWQRTVC